MPFTDIYDEKEHVSRYVGNRRITCIVCNKKYAILECSIGQCYPGKDFCQECYEKEHAPEEIEEER